MAGGLDPRGPVAGEIAGLWWLLFWLGLAVFAVYVAVLAYGLLRRRPAAAPPPRDMPEAPDVAESARYLRRWVVGLGVVMTAAVLVVVLVATIASMRAIPVTAATDALVVEVVGHQWYWEAHYPGGRTTTGEVRIPAGRQVELHLSSADVIHSFWVPALAGKIDALPDRTNTLVLEADEPGRYLGRCAEFCGLHHADMQVVVVAMPVEGFEEWLEGSA